MRVIQTVNDTIRLLFNPKTEFFCLSDFLLVRDSNENFLAQVIEIYDDKFDQEANVAKIKLIYRIKNSNEIVPYDNYTPSRECEVAKIKQSEIERCINLHKNTIELGKNPKTSESVKINTDFFDNNLVIFSDKYEQTNSIFDNLASRLSSYKNVLILDFSGSMNKKDSSSFVACGNFKLPLSSNTIDYIQQKTLLRAKLETQVVLGDVFEEVKSYLESTEENYIPFQRFIRVIQNQCRQTPSVELLVLISWLKKYARAEIFAKNKREVEGLFRSIEKNKITTLDLSNIKSEWQKEFVEYILNKIENEVFVFVRLNDNNINNDIINSIYLKKKNISFIPSISYGYKKASYIMDFAHNYLLMPTLNPKRDFTHATFQIEALNKESFMIFGEDTKDFIFLIENKSPIKVKKDENEANEKLFISLNLQLEDMTPLELRPDDFEIKTQELKKKHVQKELSLKDILGEEKKEETKETIEKAPPEVSVQVVDINENGEEIKPEGKEEPKEIEEHIELNLEPIEDIKPKEEENSKTDIEQEKNPVLEDNNVLFEDELDFFEQEENEVESQSQTDEIKQNETDHVNEKEETIKQETIKEEATKETTIKEEKQEELANQTNKDNSSMPKIKEIEPNKEETKEENELKEFAKVKSVAYDNDKKEQIISDEIKEEFESIIDDVIKEDSKKEENLNQKAPLEHKSDEKRAEITIEEIKPDIKDEKEEKLNQENSLETKSDEQKTNEDNKDEEDIDKKFDAILNETTSEEIKAGILKVNDDVTIDINKIQKDTNERKLPVFDDEDDDAENTPQASFNEGDKVSHEKYGEGTILKVIKYSERCLLQIEFPQVGKRLLDPKIAKLTMADDI